ncbi:MAG: helix-hairpin-helix domain-containing protein [candidate division KSB1 bacterium]|nr:helix-hairpin-helix domain-containing protein [candidate division KSB1 bacterium]MDZ7340304.1 helix-hairpin-helix domain-containing protein [candidate division KSB1 bacterium]
MRLRYWLYIFIGLNLASCLFAQQTDLDWFLERGDEFEDASDVLENLAELERHPLDLNQATEEQLLLLPWITSTTARRVIAHRKKFGAFHELDDLAQIPRFNIELIPLLRPYVVVKSADNQRSFSVAIKNRMIQKLEKSVGLRTGMYYPSPAKVYNRFILGYKNRLTAGILTEKDSGERRWNDLGLAFVKYNDSAHNHKFIAGNYRLEFAHGLVLGNPLYYGKSYQPLLPARRQSRELVECALVDENASLHGIAGQLSFKFYQIFIFYSKHYLDASLNPDGSIRNFYTSGYHRNATELSKKDQLAETMVGTRVGMQPANHLSLGVTAYRSHYGQFIQPETKAYSLFAFRGKKNSVVGLDFSANAGVIHFFGEAARSENNGHGLIAGATWEASVIDLALIARHYSKDFQSLHGKAFGESNNQPQNETGVYMGLQLAPLRRLKFILSYDQFKFPWATYLIPLPATGAELLFRTEYRSRHKLNCYLQLKATQKDHTLSYVDELKRDNRIITVRHQLTARWQLEYQPWQQLRIRGRLETTWINYEVHEPALADQFPRRHGLLLFQEAQFAVNKNLTVNGRLTFFDTEDYDSRLYQFEQDVPALMANCLLYGVGNRWYLNVQWKFGSLLRLSAKFTSTRYFYQNTIGSGWDLIPGDRLHDLHVQFEAWL